MDPQKVQALLHTRCARGMGEVIPVAWRESLPWGNHSHGEVVPVGEVKNAPRGGGGFVWSV